MKLRLSSVLANQKEGKSLSSDAVAVESASELWITQEDSRGSFPKALEPGISLGPLGGHFSPGVYSAIGAVNSILPAL